MSNISKIVHKGSAWSHHGRRHLNGLVIQRARRPKAKARMYSSIDELLRAETRRGKR